MSNANINIRTDAALKTQAQQIYESIGLDLSTAINLFLKQTVKANDLPFTIGMPYVNPTENIFNKRVSRYGVWKGKYSLPKGFDDPIDDFKEYM